MEISNISEILRRNTQREKYNSGFVFYKNNYVTNNYTNLNGSNANFYGSVYDENMSTYGSRSTKRCKISSR